MSTSETKETSSASEERVCILCDTDLGHLPLKEFRAHIEQCLNQPSSKDAVSATPEHPDTAQPPPHLTDTDTSTDTDATLTDDDLQPRDLPPPYASSPTTTPHPPLTPPTTFLTSLSHPHSRSTRALHAITHNTQTALLTWQDEYLSLETQLAKLSEHKPRVLHPRRPLDPRVFEDIKTAALYGFKYDGHESRVGAQDPWAELRRGRVVGGKVLRVRRGRGRGVGGGESEDEGTGMGGRRGKGSETGGSRAASVVGVGRRKRRFEETPEAGLSSDAARRPPLRKRGRPRLMPLVGSRLGVLDGRGGTAATSEATTEAELGIETGLETEDGGTPGPAPGMTFAAGSGTPGRLNLLETKRRGRKPRLGTAAAVGRLPGLAEEGAVGPEGPPKEKKRKGRPPGVFGKYWGEAAKKLKLKSQMVVDSGADS